MADLLLVFPPLTEARYFPYLSLPTLAAYAATRGISVAQADLNLELTRHVVETHAPRQEDDFGLALSAYLAQHRETLVGVAFDKRQGTDLPWPVAEQIVYRVLDDALHGSVLAEPVGSIRQLMALANRPVGGDDDATAWFESVVAARITVEQPLVIGVTVAFFSQLAPALRAAVVARRTSPSLRILLGGPQIMLYGAELSRLEGIFEVVDGLCLDSGEEAVVDAVLKWPAETGQITGCITASGIGPRTRHHIRSSPPPALDGLPTSSYLNSEVQLPVVSCVGCYWGRCVFCSYGNRSLNSGYQQLTRDQLAERVMAGIDATGARRVTFVDENSNVRLLLHAVERAHANGYDFEWSTRNRFERYLADRHFCERLARSRCVLMSVGYETNSQRLLDLADKGVDASTYQEIIDQLDAAGIRLRLSVLGGLFDETTAETQASMNFLAKNADKVGIDVAQMLIIEPTSLLASRPEEFGLSLLGTSGLTSNAGLSSFGGRHGPAFDYTSGADRSARLAEFAVQVQSVRPGKNLAVHPRHRSTSSATFASALLAPWAIPQQGDGCVVVTDLAWAIRYRLPQRLFEGERRLVATDDSDARMLGALVAADAAVTSVAPREEALR